MADLTYDEVVDRLAETIGRYLASEVSGNNQPCMSGDPRDRLHPHRRRHFDSACREAAEASIQALSAAGIALVPREATEGSKRLESMQRALNRLLLEGAGDHASAAADECWEMWSDEAKALYAAAIAAGQIRER